MVFFPQEDKKRKKEKREEEENTQHFVQFKVSKKVLKKKNG